MAELATVVLYVRGSALCRHLEAEPNETKEPGLVVLVRRELLLSVESVLQ